MWDVLGNLASAGLNFLTGDQNRRQQSNYNDQQIALAQQNMAMQREFAQHGISWKVNDARAAGIHPLAALGAQTTSFSPVSVGGSAPSMDVGSMGQDISRAMSAAKDIFSREAQVQRDLATEKAKLENEFLKTQIAGSKVAVLREVGPSMAAGREHQVVSGQGDSRIPLPRPGPARTVGGVAVGDDDLKQKAEDFPATRVVRPFGYPLEAAPAVSDGQQYEDRYGDSEIGSTIKFLYNMGADHLYTAYRMFPGRTGSAARRRRASRPWGE